MVNIKPTIEAIELLIKDGSQRSLVYAALECRLAIEALCYERLKIAHAYISHDDLKGWTPKDIVNILLQEVDQSVASTQTISICPVPIAEGTTSITLTDYEAMEFLPLGTQIGFDPKYLGKLWNALANLGLHIPVPTSDVAPIDLYGATEKLLPKVSEALEEIKRISKRTWLSSGLGEEVSFACQCGQLNKRRSDLLRIDQVVSCISRECKESYVVLIEDGEFEFERRAFSVECGNDTCSNVINIPKKVAETLKRDNQIYYDCDCGNRTFVRWSLTQSRGTFSTPSA